MNQIEKTQRVGLLVPSSNSTQEPEFAATLPASVSLHVTRLSLASVDPDSTLKIVAELEKEAKKLEDSCLYPKRTKDPAKLLRAKPRLRDNVLNQLA